MDDLEAYLMSEVKSTVSSADIRAYGRQAAQAFVRDGTPMNDSIKSIVKTAGLNIEQTKRVAAERTEVDLDATGFALPPLATIAGRLVVPPEWNLDTFGIHFDLIGQAAIDGQAQRYVDRGDMQVKDPERGEIREAYAERAHAQRLERELDDERQRPQ